MGKTPNLTNHPKEESQFFTLFIGISKEQFKIKKIKKKKTLTFHLFFLRIFASRYYTLQTEQQRNIT
jgi:hypothetical protein